jgi:hypothetical protein
VQSLEYRRVRERQNVYAVGGAERIGVVAGREMVEGRISVASRAAGLDELGPDEVFSITAQLRQGENEHTVSFDDCVLMEKTFSMPVAGRGEAQYAFTATRVREGG